MVATGELSMRGGVSRLGDTCILAVAFLSAGDFFRNLTEKETPQGPEYWSNSQLVTKFPSDLKISVFMHFSGCGKDVAEAESTRKILANLDWELAWKTGMRTRDIKDFVVTFSPASLDELEKRTGWYPAFYGPSDSSGNWLATIALHGQDASLKDSLILIITTRTGHLFSRFSVHL